MAADGGHLIQGQLAARDSAPALGIPEGHGDAAFPGELNAGGRGGGKMCIRDSANTVLDLPLTKDATYDVDTGYLTCLLYTSRCV